MNKLKKQQSVNSFELEEDYFKPVRVGNFYSSNDIEYESNGGKNKTLSIKKYLDEMKSNLNDMINNFKKCDT